MTPPTPPRLADWLLARAVPDAQAAESIRGDLYEEYRRHPAVLRDVWYVVQAGRIAAGYLAFQPTGRAPGPGPATPRGGLRLTSDVRHALRRIWRRPGFAGLAMATLALGIGATTAIVSVVDNVLLRPLPYPRAEQLVTVWNTYPAWRGHEVLDAEWDRIPLSYPEYRDWRDGQTAFARVAIYSTGPATLTGVGDPALITVGAASSTLCPLLGVRPALGRTFVADDEGAAGRRVAMVSYEFWRARLGGAADVLGRVLSIDGEGYEVVGVLSPGFRVRTLRDLAAPTPEVWVPAGLFGDATERGWHHYEAIARLRPGVSLARAAAEAAPLLRGERDPSRMGVRVLPRQAVEVATARAPLLVLLAAAGLLMLIAAVNVATLFTAEAARRQHELATRWALGASRGRLVRQLVVESGTIGALGAVAGSGVAALVVPALLALAPPELGLPRSLPLDVRVLAASALFGALVGIAFGVAPALLFSRLTTSPSGMYRTVTRHAGSARLQRAMVAVEAALAVVLLVGAGLLGRTLLALWAVDPGFRTQNLVAVSLPLSGAQTEPRLVVGLAHDLMDRLAALPGVETVTGASAVPFAGEGGSSSFEIEGRPAPPGAKQPEAHRRFVLPGFFETLGIPVLEGRALSAEDREDARPVVVVSRSLAERYWPGRSPLGAHIVRDSRRWEIVGVVGDVLHADLRETRQSTFYFSFFQQPPERFWLVVRSPLPVGTLAPAVRRTVRELAPEVAIGRLDLLGRLVAASTAPARYRAALVAVFGGCSLLLAAVGLFGLTARMVSARRRELGIRLVLGAGRAQIMRTVMAAEARALALGVTAGLVLASAATHALGGLLFGVPPRDAITFGGAAAVLAVVGAIACYLPARRTAAADPVEVLRAE